MNLFIIGNNCRIHSGYSNFVGASSKTAIWVGQNGVLTIGSNVGISNTTFVCENSIQIEDYVFIGGGTRIYDNDFHSLSKKIRINNPNEIPSKPIHIKEGAFIGGHSIILKGVIIGENSVVGAGSVVVKNIPPNEVWAGVPAKKLRDL